MTGAVVLFLAVWALITVKLVTGHDPALARQAATRPATETTGSGGSGTVTTSTSTTAAASVTPS
ncbi:MAG: hypothetical protein ACLPZR_20180 [Solirubrobacteraceae bacterium]